MVICAQDAQYTHHAENQKDVKYIKHPQKLEKRLRYSLALVIVTMRGN